MSVFGLPQSKSSSPALQRIRAAGLAYEAKRRGERMAAENAIPRPNVIDRKKFDEMVEAAAERAHQMNMRIALVRLALGRSTASLVEQPEVPPNSVRHELVAKIKQEACLVFNVTMAELLSARRPRRIAMARHYACQRMADETSLSFMQIGRVMGGRDHTTAMHSVKPAQRKRVSEWLADRLPE